jgi:hypothetical protein
MTDGHSPKLLGLIPRPNLARDGAGLVGMLLCAIAFTALPVITVFRKPGDNKDYSRWWFAAKAIRNGEPLFPTSGEHFNSFIYPPASAVLFYTPLSLLGYLPMVLLVAALTLAGWFTALALSVWYARGRAGGEPSTLYILPAAATMGFTWDAFYLGQPNLALLGVMMLGFYALDHRRPMIAGWLFAVAAMIKAFPVTVIGYLCWRRHFKAAITMAVATAVLLIVIPGPFRGFGRNFDETSVWVHRMVLGTSGDQLADQPDRAFRYGNQSLMSVVHRFTRHVEAGDAGDPMYVNIVDIGSRGAFVVFAVIAGALCLAYVCAMPPRRLLTRRIRGLEYAILLIMIPMFSPKAGTYYFAWSLPGMVMLVSEAMSSANRSRRWWVLWSCTWTSIAITASGLAQAREIYTTQALGSTLWGAMVELVTLLGLLFGAKRRVAAGTEPLDALEPRDTARPVVSLG